MAQQHARDGGARGNAIRHRARRTQRGADRPRCGFIHPAGHGYDHHGTGTELRVRRAEQPHGAVDLAGWECQPRKPHRRDRDVPVHADPLAGVPRGWARHHAAIELDTGDRAVTLWSRDERGQALILIAIALGGLLLGIGLALDTGQLFVARRAAQTAADAGAWAGAAVLYAGGSAAQARTAAATDATRNGYTDGGFVTVTTTSPPASGTYANDPGYIEVTITEQVLTRFLPGASGSRTPITVRAVAGLARSGSGLAVIVTRPTGNTTFQLSNASRFTVTGGGTNTNTSSANSIQIAGGGAFLTATFNRFTGGVQAADAARMSPAPTTLVAAVADPFLSLAGPSTTG